MGKSGGGGGGGGRGDVTETGGIRDRLAARAAAREGVYPTRPAPVACVSLAPTPRPRPGLREPRGTSLPALPLVSRAARVLPY